MHCCVSFQFDPGDEKDPNRLKKLFAVAQTIMVTKGTAAEVVEEQLREYAVGEGRTTVKKGEICWRLWYCC